MIKRRSFLQGMMATSALASRVAAASNGDDIGEVQLRLGLLADIHITNRTQQPYFEKALRQMDEWKVDAVVACGDLANYGLKQ